MFESLLGEALSPYPGTGNARRRAAMQLSTHFNAEAARRAAQAFCQYAHKSPKDKFDTMRRAEPVSEIKELEIRDEIKESSPF